MRKRILVGVRAFAATLIMSACAAGGPTVSNAAVCDLRLEADENPEDRLVFDTVQGYDPSVGNYPIQTASFRGDYAAALLDASANATPAVQQLVAGIFELRRSEVYRQAGALSEQSLDLSSTAALQADEDLARTCRLLEDGEGAGEGNSGGGGSFTNP